MQRRLRHIGFWKEVHQKRMYLEKCSGRSAFFKILIHMHNLKMCSGSSSSGRLTVASIAFLFELHVEVCLSPQPPLPPNFNVGSSCFSCAAALAFGTCAQPTNSSACGGVSRAILLFNNVVASARAVPARVEAVQLEHVVSGSLSPRGKLAMQH